MGDFNIDLLSTTQTHGQRLKILLYTYALHPHIDKPTGITNTSSTLIDNIFSTNFSNETTNGILYYDISDHLPIFMINIASLNSDLAQAEWQDVFSENNVNHAYDKFLHKLLVYYDKNIPLVKTKTKKRVKNPWITKGILRSIHIRNRFLN